MFLPVPNDSTLQHLFSPFLPTIPAELHHFLYFDYISDASSTFSLNECVRSIDISVSPSTQSNTFFLFYFTSIWIELLLWVVWVLVHHWRGWVKESRAIFHSRSVPELRPLLKRESEFRGGDRSNERSDDRNDAWVFSCCGGRAPLQSSSGYIYLHLNHLHNSAAITAPRHSRKYHIHNTKYESFSIRKLGFFSSPVYSQYMTQKSHF